MYVIMSAIKSNENICIIWAMKKVVQKVFILMVS